jgi:hypothetical protein
MNLIFVNGQFYDENLNTVDQGWPRGSSYKQISRRLPKYVMIRNDSQNDSILYELLREWPNQIAL